MTITSSDGAQADGRASTRLYRAIWRWHFYAGLVVVPFFILLAGTGMIMLYGNSVETMLGPRHQVDTAARRVSIIEQAIAAAGAIPVATSRCSCRHRKLTSPTNSWCRPRTALTSWPSIRTTHL